MRRKLLGAVWFVVVPLIALRVWGDQAVKGWWIDTSPAAVARIKPGMTIAEVEQIVGGPPGEYCFVPPIMSRWHGNRVPHWVIWATPSGLIVVIDGYTESQSSRECTASGTTQVVNLGDQPPPASPRGVVVSINHIPMDALFGDELASWSWRAAVCFGVPFVMWRIRRE